MTESDWWAASEPYKLIDWVFFDRLGADRKFRLFSVACCRSVVPHLQQFAESVTTVLSQIQTFADGLTPQSAFAIHRDELDRLWRDYDDEGTRHYSEHRSAHPSVDYPISDEEASFWFVSQCGVRAAYFGTTHAEERDNPASQYRQRGFYGNRRLDQRVFPVAVAAESAQALVCAADEPEQDVRAVINAHQVRLLHNIFGPLPFRDVAGPPSWLTSDVVLLARGIYDDKAFDRMPILADALQDAGCDNDEVLNHCRDTSATHVRGCWVIDLLLGRPWREP